MLYLHTLSLCTPNCRLKWEERPASSCTRARQPNSQAIRIPLFFFSSHPLGAYNICCAHTSQHMTCWSHLMKLSGNECSSLMTEEGRTTTLHSDLTEAIHLFFYWLAGQFFLIYVVSVNQGADHVAPPNTTSSSDSRPGSTSYGVDRNPVCFYKDIKWVGKISSCALYWKKNPKTFWHQHNSLLVH